MTMTIGSSISSCAAVQKPCNACHTAALTMILVYILRTLLQNSSCTSSVTTSTRVTPTTAGIPPGSTRVDAHTRTVVVLNHVPPNSPSPRAPRSCRTVTYAAADTATSITRPVGSTRAPAAAAVFTATRTPPSPGPCQLSHARSMPRCGVTSLRVGHVPSHIIRYAFAEYHYVCV